MDIESFGSPGTTPAEELEYIEMTTEELATAIREGAVICTEPIRGVRYEVSLVGVLQVVIGELATAEASELGSAFAGSLERGISAEVQSRSVISLNDETLDRGETALFLRALAALAIVTGR
nr:hypothetical protein KPHV_85810 [Kitasatospora purpeofusca]